MSIPKIYTINRDRALQLMWKLDAEYDEASKGFPDSPLKYSYIKKEFNYNKFKKWITYEEWLFTNIYFLNGYTADKVIKRLETELIILQ